MKFKDQSLNCLFRHLGLAPVLLLVLGASTSVEANFTSTFYQLPGGIVDKSSPTLADLTGDGRPEVLIGTTTCKGDQQGKCAYTQDAILAVYQSEGLFWYRRVDAPINSSPAVGDINRDGYPEIVVTIGGDVYDVYHHGGAIAFDRFGNPLWRFYTQDHNRDGYKDGVFSSPTLCDVNNDGYLEVVFGGWDQRIYLLDYQGRPLWNNLPSGFPGPGYYNADTIWSTAACADLNRDGYQEIIVGADITGGGILPDGTQTQDGGFLYIFDKDGNVLVRRYLSETIYASPAVGDLDRDGDLEIVSGTGWYWWDAHKRNEQPYVYVFDTGRVFDPSLHYSDPAKLPFLNGWPQPTEYPGFSSPALGDLDGDGDLEIVIGTGHPDLQNDHIDGAGKVYAWHHNGIPVNRWPVQPKNQQGADGPIFSSPTIANVDSDESPEVLFSMLWDIQLYDASGNLQDRLNTYWTIWGSPAVGDTDGNGLLEIWVGGGRYYNPEYGHLWRFELQTPVTQQMPWPMFHRDPRHTGYYPSPPRLSISPASLYVLHQYGSGEAEKVYLNLRNPGDGAFNWAVSSQPAGVTVTPLSGIVFYTSTVPLTVTVSTTGYQTGTHSLGSVVITGTSGGNPVQGSPASVPVTLYVGQVYRTYLPIVLRTAR
ncbi:MAG: VCBS repeat-containing protein [Thermoflexales bacterium]|nr:VCBS repeat-containing protein [Thermoflexales bacterium]